jgi:putative flippase GtrA
VRQGSTRSQGTRFLSINLVSFVTSLMILAVLVDIVEVAKVPAQATALAVVAPLTVVWNNFWSLRS